jgi:hypothetical protein
MTSEVCVLPVVSIVDLSSGNRRCSPCSSFLEDILYYQLDVLAREAHDMDAHWMKYDSVY